MKLTVLKVERSMERTVFSIGPMEGYGGNNLFDRTYGENNLFDRTYGENNLCDCVSGICLSEL